MALLNPLVRWLLIAIPRPIDDRNLLPSIVKISSFVRLLNTRSINDNKPLTIIASESVWKEKESPDFSRIIHA